MQGDLNRIDEYFSKEKFNATILGEIIEDIVNPYKVLEECNKILKEEGIILITTPNPIGFPQLFFELISSTKYFYTIYHTYAYIPRWMIRFIDSSGFFVKKRIGFFGGVVFLVQSFFHQKFFMLRKNKKVLFQINLSLGSRLII
ncbi:MAG: hypothetical protein ACOCWG_04350 [bacterium]